MPSEYVSTSSRSLRYSCTTLRSVALIASRATGPAAADRVQRRLVGLALERLLAPGAVARRVDDHAHAAAAAVAVGDLEGQVLHRVDGLAVAADEQAEVVALEHAADALLGLLDVHLGVEPERVADGLEHLAYAVDRVLRPLSGLAHRLLPERFFLRRGGAGGGPLGRPFGSLPAMAGVDVAFGALDRLPSPWVPSRRPGRRRRP